MKLERQSSDFDRPFLNLLPVVNSLVENGNRLIEDGFIQNPDGWRCRLEKLIDFEFLRSRFNFPDTIVLSETTDSILDTLSWCVIEGPSSIDGRPEEVVIIQSLPSTAKTDDGPVIYNASCQVLVYYDHESNSEDGFATWGLIQFHSAFATKWTPDIASTQQMIKAYSKVAFVENSIWLTDIRLRAEGRRKSINDGVNHYLIYFDHFGCLEVLADSFEFVDEVESPKFHLLE